jgi:hypothetical protein
MRLEFWHCSCKGRNVGIHITAIYHSTRISLKFRKETCMWWCRCAVSEFLLKIIQRLGRKPCYSHASCYYCIAAHKVIDIVFYCIAEARFPRRNPSSLLLCVTIRLVLQNDTYSPTFTFLSMVNYSTIKPLNMPIPHT